jgi:hypothetical protein
VLTPLFSQRKKWQPWFSQFLLVISFLGLFFLDSYWLFPFWAYFSSILIGYFLFGPIFLLWKSCQFFIISEHPLENDWELGLRKWFFHLSWMESLRKKCWDFIWIERRNSIRLINEIEPSTTEIDWRVQRLYFLFEASPMVAFIRSYQGPIFVCFLKSWYALQMQISRMKWKEMN